MSLIPYSARQIQNNSSIASPGIFTSGQLFVVYIIMRYRTSFRLQPVMFINSDMDTFATYVCV